MGVGYGRSCEDRSCYPATGNLLIGRQTSGRSWNLTSNSTCGEKRRERYCILSHIDPDGRKSSQQRDSCFWCDSSAEGERNNPKISHRIKNIVYRWYGKISVANFYALFFSMMINSRFPPEKPRAEQYRTWWQSENSVNHVTIQLDLEAEFHVTHLIITFKSSRPAAMYIEKSFDWGQTWNIQRYFAADCDKAFPNVPKV